MPLGSFRQSLNLANLVAEPATFAVAAAAGATSVNEGSSLTFNVTGTNIVNGTYFFTVTNSGDFATSSGSFTITSNAGSFSVTPTADNTTEGAETFQAQVRTGSTSGTIVATSATITINDTSTSSDAPTIPTLSWTTPAAWHTSTFNNATRYKVSSMIGDRADGLHYLSVRGDTSNGRTVHNNNANLSQTLGLGTAPTSSNSASLFSTVGTKGGNTLGIHANATRLRAVVGAVQNWATTPTQTSVPTGAISSTLYTRAGGTNTDTAITTICDTTSNATRALVMFKGSGTTTTAGQLNMIYLAANAGASTFQTQSLVQVVTNSINVFDHMGLAGFSNQLTSASRLNDWIVGWRDVNSYKVQGGTSNFWDTNAGTKNWDTTLLTATGFTAGGLATAWDDFANNKKVAVGMLLDGTTIKARAINSSGTMGTSNESIATGAHQAKISQVKTSTSNGFGMVLITYLKSSATTQIHGKLISVDSTTLELTVGPEMLITNSGGGYNIGVTPSYGIDAAKDGTNWYFTMVFANGANGNGGASVATATG